MAIVQDFEADFSQYKAAVGDAQTQLKGFAADAEKVAGQLGTMTDKVPDNLKTIAATTKDVTSETQNWYTSLVSVTQGFLALSAVRFAREYVNQILDGAEALDNLSKQVQISAGDLQALAGVMSGSGVDADTLGRSLYTLSRRAAGDDTSVASAVHLLGMSLDAIKNKDGADLFIAIEKGLSTLQGGLRDTAAAELFGAKLGMAMSGAADDIDGLITKWREHNTVVETENVKALAEYNRAIKDTETNLANLTANTIGPVAQGVNVLVGAFQKGGDAGKIFGAMTLDALAAKGGYFVNVLAQGNPVMSALISKMAEAAGGGMALTRVLDDLNTQANANAKATGGATAAGTARTKQLTEQEQHEAFIAGVYKDSAKTITEWQASQLAALDKVGLATVKNAAGIGVSADQYARWRKETDAATESLKKFNDENDKFNAAVAEVMSAGDGWKGTLAGMDQGVVSLGEDLLRAGVSAESVRRYLSGWGVTATQVAAMGKAVADSTEQLKLQKEALKATTDLWDAYYAERASHGATALQQEQANLDKWYNDQVAAAEAAGKATGEFYDALGALYYEKQQKFLVDWKAVNDTTQKETRQGLQDTADAAQRFYQYALTQVGVWSDGTIQKARDAADAAQLAANQFGAGFAAAGDTAAAGVQKVNTALDATKQKTDAALASAIALADQYNRNMGIQAANAAYAGATSDALSPGSSRGGYTVGQLLGSGSGFMAPRRAAGGPVAAGSPYIVGEAGPELFVPSSSGSILPNGGGIVINNTFHLVDTESNLARRVSDLIGRSVTGARRV